MRSLSALLLVSAASAIDNLCVPGSDAECARYGKNMCCAHIQYNWLGDEQDFYACASKPGIEYTDGKISDPSGFTGTWYCALATQTTAAIATTLAVTSLIYF